MKRVITWIVLTVFGMVMVGCTMEQPRPPQRPLQQLHPMPQRKLQSQRPVRCWRADSPSGRWPKRNSQRCLVPEYPRSVGNASLISGEFLVSPLILAEHDSSRFTSS